MLFSGSSVFNKCDDTTFSNTSHEVWKRKEIPIGYHKENEKKMEKFQKTSNTLGQWKKLEVDREKLIMAQGGRMIDLNVVMEFS